MINDIPGNAATFARSLNTLAGYSTGNIEKVIRKSCIDLYRAIVARNPVKTGRSKANWMISTTDSSTINESVTDIESFINAEISDFSFKLTDDKVVIYNNLEYIEKLEGGSSQQAPAGMVSISLVEFTRFFNRAIAEIEGLDPA